MRFNSVTIPADMLITILNFRWPTEQELDKFDQSCLPGLLVAAGVGGTITILGLAYSYYKARQRKNNNNNGGGNDKNDDDDDIYEILRKTRYDYLRGGRYPVKAFYFLMLGESQMRAFIKFLQKSRIRAGFQKISRNLINFLNNYVIGFFRN